MFAHGNAAVFRRVQQALPITNIRERRMKGLDEQRLEAHQVSHGLQQLSDLHLATKNP